MEFKARDIAALLHGVVEGDPEVGVNDVSKIEEGREGTLAFLANPKYESYIYSTRASIVLVDEAFTLAMNALVGEAYWERGDLSFNLFTQTVSVERLVIRLPESAPAARVDVDLVKIRGGPGREEFQRLLSLDHWANQPEVKLASSIVMTEISLQGSRTKPLRRASFSEIRAEGLVLGASSFDTPRGVLPPLIQNLKVGGLSFAALDAVVASGAEELELKVDSFDIKDYNLAPPGQGATEALRAIQSLRLGGYDLKGLTANFRGRNERFTMSLASQSYKGVEGLKIGSIAYEGLKMAFDGAPSESFQAELGSFQVDGLDAGPLVTCLAIAMESGYGDPEECQTVADLITGSVAYDKISLTDLRLSIAGEMSIVLASAEALGPVSPGKLGASTSTKMDGLTVSLIPGGELYPIAEPFGLASLSAMHSTQCTYEEAPGRWSCQAAPLIHIPGQARLELSFTLTGLTPALLGQLSDISVYDIEEVEFIPRAAQVRLELLRVDLANEGLSETLYMILGTMDVSRSEIDSEIHSMIEALPLMAPPTANLSGLQSDLRDFMSNPRQLSVQISPTHPLVDYVNIEHMDEIELIDNLRMTVSINGRPPILIRLGGAAPMAPLFGGGGTPAPSGG